MQEHSKVKLKAEKAGDEALEGTNFPAQGTRVSD